MENMSIESSCSEEASRNQQSIESEQEVQAADGVLSGRKYQTCPVLLRQQGNKLTSATLIKLDGSQVMSQP